MVCGGKSLKDNDSKKREHTSFTHDLHLMPRHKSKERQDYNYVRTNTVPVLTADKLNLSPKPLVWGFPKFTGSGVIINARVETAGEKKTFRESLLTNRCIVPSTGFYEWNAQKKKYLFRLPGEQVLYMAGISKEYDGTQRYVILTTSANELSAQRYAATCKDRIMLLFTPD